MSDDRTDRLPAARQEAEIGEFLRDVARAPAVRPGGGRGRLIFAMDATASRQPSWDRACRIQGEMFAATDALGGLSVRLMFYRGFGECKASRWMTSSTELHRAMRAVSCVGGETQIERVLASVAGETRRQHVDALVFVGDAMEENVDRLCHLAGELGLLGVPVFVFHEGGEPRAAAAFRQIAALSHGAYLNFDAASAERLKDLLGAVAVYAAGGCKALAAYGERRGDAVLRLSAQLR